MSKEPIRKSINQRRYPPGLRERAVRMVRDRVAENGQRHGAVTVVARQLGVGAQSLRNWLNQADVDSGQKAGLTTDEGRREVADKVVSDPGDGPEMISMDYSRARRLAQELARDETGHEERLVCLRSARASQVMCVKLVRELEGVALGRAKVIVDESPAWADKRPSTSKSGATRALVAEQLEADPTLLASNDENMPA